jgi:hypothetical protein
VEKECEEDVRNIKPAEKSGNQLEIKEFMAIATLTVIRV